MRLSRNINATVTLIVICGLFFGLPSEGQNSDAEDGRQPTDYAQQWNFVLPVSCVAGAVGVILFVWYWLRLGRAITSIARLLNNDSMISPGIANGFFVPIRARQIDKLCNAVRERIDSVTLKIAEYEKKIKELQIQIQLSRKREKNIEAIIYSIRDAVVVVDEFDKLLMANEAAEKLFTFDLKDSQHKPIGELIGENYIEILDFLSHSKQSKEQAIKREIELSKNEFLRIYDCIVSCIYNQNRQVSGAVMVLHDITQEKEISRMKNDFVSHVSHELKTPLASITAYSEMLADGEAEDEKTRKEFYSIIQNQANRLNRLIEDILNISRIESGLIKINKEPISLTILIEEQLQMIKSYAEEKNIEVTGQKPIVFDQVLADRDMISQAVINLLSNAVKYTRPGGSVKIETEVDEMLDLIRVSVRDTGVGIPEDEIEHVFDKYYRVGANNKQAKGTGLGLNLVKQIIEKVHNGRVFVKSQVGRGSTFGFELPLVKVQTAGAL